MRPAGEDLIIERVLCGNCPICNKPLKGEDLKENETTVGYKGFGVEIHKKHKKY